MSTSLNDLNSLIGSSAAQNTAATSNQDQLGQDDFLALMTTQLANQDPLAPLENGDFIAQIAQFSQVDATSQLLDSFNGLAANLQSSQALQASNLLGRDALFASEQGFLDDSGLQGALNLEDSAADVNVNIYNEVNELVGVVNLGERPAGLTNFNWDGVQIDGTRANNGRYRVEVQSTSPGGITTAEQPYVQGRVSSLTLGGVGEDLQVDVDNLGQFGFSEVFRIL